MNISEFLSETFHFFGGQIFSIIEKACFRNVIILKVVNDTHIFIRPKMMYAYLHFFSFLSFFLSV